jgi:hypothetical protein
MLDSIFMAILVSFTLATWGLLVLCERLLGGQR